MSENLAKIDALGQACPIPIIRTKKALRDHNEVEILVDTDVSTQNLEKMAKQLNYQYAMKQLAPDQFQVNIAKAGTTTATAPATPAATVTASTPTDGDADQPHIESSEVGQIRLSQGYTVVINTNTMGQGDEKLGQTLLKSFVYSLTEQDVLPEYILFYNGGVQLVAEGSDSVEDLQALAAQGVKILSCGVCINYFDLKEKMAVGEITNMFRIVEIMRKSQRLVRP